MPWQQRLQLMQAMDCLLARRYPDAADLFSRQSALSPWAVWFWLPLMLAAFGGYLHFLFRNPDPIVLVVGLAFFLLVVWVFAYSARDEQVLDDYLERRTD